MKLVEKMWRALFASLQTRPQSDQPLPTPVRPRVLTIIHNPTVKSDNDRKLHEVLNWNDPDVLMRQYIADVRDVSYGYANYDVVERIEVDGFPVKEDGFIYTTADYISRWRTRTGFHHPDRVDYIRLLAQFDVVSKINRGQIDEVWLLAFPYAGYYESVMGGPGAFWCNAPPLSDDLFTDHCRRSFVVMGFNYERGVGEMLESLGHRAESIMSHVYRHRRGDANLWQRFTRYDKRHAGAAECGTVHFAPNSERDYDWGNRRWVMSRCDDWYNFPNFQGVGRRVNCSEWGNGDTRSHHLWWFRHMPHIQGKSNGITHNWWEYIIYPHRVR